MVKLQKEILKISGNYKIIDNNGVELVVKEHNHLCERFNFKDIKELKVYKGV